MEIKKLRKDYGLRHEPIRSHQPRRPWSETASCDAGFRRDVLGRVSGRCHQAGRDGM